MKKTHFKTLALGLLLSTAIITLADAATYTLRYQGENRWVAKEDAKQLRELIRTARAQKFSYFKVQLPEDKRDISVGRLIVLRDILEKQLKRGVIIEEIEESSDSNTIIVEMSK